MPTGELDQLSDDDLAPLAQSVSVQPEAQPLEEKKGGDKPKSKSAPKGEKGDKPKSKSSDSAKPPAKKLPPPKSAAAAKT